MLNLYKQFPNLALVYLVSALLTSLVVQGTGILSRLENETIDRRFEDRPFLTWSAEGLSRIDPQKLWTYHEQHEIPRRWYAWDYTLSWLVAENHRPTAFQFAIFNRLPEDDPPEEAVRVHSWMRPLATHPISRKTLADFIRVMVNSGVRMVVLNLDLPGMTAEDAMLAATIRDAASGAISGRKVPVLIAREVVVSDSGPYAAMRSRPSGVLSQLEKLTGGETHELVGLWSPLRDPDHVVRRYQCAVQLPLTGIEPSVAVKAVHMLKGEIPADLTEEIYIDYIAPPDGDTYKVRPWSYLLEPSKKAQLLQGRADIEVKDAVVIIGDGVSDLHPTPFAAGASQMSDSEILAQSLDTILSRSWLGALNNGGTLVYLTALCTAMAALFLGWKFLVRVFARRLKLPLNEKAAWTFSLFMCDVPVFVINVALAWVIALLAFAYFGIIVPVLASATGLAVAALVTSVVDREQLRSASMRMSLKSIQDRFTLVADKHEAELREQQTKAQNEVMKREEEQRREFFHRINHDLKAPVTTLNWTLARLRRDAIRTETYNPKFDVLSETADRLFDLVNELLRTYGCETNGASSAEKSDTDCSDLKKMVHKSVQVAGGLAEMKGSTLTLIEAEEPVLIQSNGLRISRVLDNLIGNAIRHNPPGTQITVTVEQSDGESRVHIADNGIGSAETIVKIMSVPPVGDHGLGLSIARSLVEELNGKISVTDVTGGGIRFTLVFPAAQRIEMPHKERTHD